jgi:putative transcriptional regulator
MDEALFSELLESVQEALEHTQGKRNLKTTVLPPPPVPMDAQEVRNLRSRLDASQAVFASYLNVSTKLVQAWEADRRTPEGAALRLLRLAEKAPELLLTGTAMPKARNRRSRAGESGKNARRRTTKPRSV